MSSIQILRRFFMLVVISAVAMVAHADGRTFPDNVQRGVLTSAAAPTIVINGTITQSTPSTRIYNEANLIIQPAYLGATSKVINYTLDSQGNVDRIWILTNAEASLPLPAKQVHRN